jgi:hypothetical protein
LVYFGCWGWNKGHVQPERLCMTLILFPVPKEAEALKENVYIYFISLRHHI